MPAVQETIDQVKLIDVDQYKYGFSTDIEVDKAPKGLNEDIIRFISAKKEDPEGRWDTKNKITVDLPFGELQSITTEQLLAGVNIAAVQSSSGAYEII